MPLILPNRHAGGRIWIRIIELANENELRDCSANLMGFPPRPSRSGKLSPAVEQQVGWDRRIMQFLLAANGASFPRYFNKARVPPALRERGEVRK